MNNRTQANRVLLFVFITFLTVTALEFYLGQNPWLNLLRFGLEGALVGGIADWFAVTALFGKPLGIAWHTALIPRNREKFITAITRLVEEELLSVKTLEAKLPQLQLTRRLLDWVVAPSSAPLLQDYLKNLVNIVVSSVEPQELARELDALVRPRLKAVQATPHIQALLEHLLTDTRLKSQVWETVTLLLGEPETKRAISTLLSAQQAKIPGFLEVLLTKSDTLNIDDAAASLQAELVSLLEQAVAAPDNPLRLQVEKWLTDLVTGLTEGDFWRENLPTWQNLLVDQTELTHLFESMLQSLFRGGQLESTLAARMYQWVVRFAGDLAGNAAIVRWLDKQVGSLLSELIATQHYLIGNIVRESLNALTDEKLNIFVQSRVGQDLQWIRINGSMLGGAIGVLVYLLLYGVYRPLLLS